MSLTITPLARSPKPSTPVSADHVLSIDWYFDPDIYAEEIRLLFESGLQYVGHELMVPNVGDYAVLDRFDRAQMLVHGPDGFGLVSNVCRHRQALMLEGSGSLPQQRISCPLHRWAYDIEGQLQVAPQFPENPCLHLARNRTSPMARIAFPGQRRSAGITRRHSPGRLFRFFGLSTGSNRID